MNFSNKLIIGIAAMTFLLSSCARHFGAFSPVETAPNLVYEDVAIGTASTNYFLGFGGLSKDALLHEAKKSLFKARPLRQGEAYYNYTVNYKWVFYGLVNKTKLTLTADVGRLSKDSIYEPFSPSYKTKLGTTSSDSIEIFAISDSVVVLKSGKFIQGVLNEINPQRNSIILKYCNTQGEILTKKYSINRVYSFQKQLGQFKRGVKVAMEIKNARDGSTQIKDGKVLAVSKNKVVVDIEGSKEVIEPSKKTNMLRVL